MVCHPERAPSLRKSRDLSRPRDASRSLRYINARLACILKCPTNLRNYMPMRFLFTALVATLLTLAACTSHSAPPPTQRYALTGKVESIDAPHQTISVNGDAISGFMPAMTMDYKVKNPDELKLLKADDSISATLVKQQDDYWLENIKIVHAPSSQVQPQVK